MSDPPQWTGREPCRDPSNDKNWWMAEPMPEDSADMRRAKLMQRHRAQQLCQDCPHTSWVQCAQLALAAEGTSEPSFGVWAGVFLFDATNYRRRGERQEAVAQLNAIAATGLAPIVTIKQHHYGQHPRMTENQIAEAREMRANGIKWRIIAAKFGLSDTTVRRTLKLESVGAA
jgi:Transcription factor WhiB